MDIFNYVEKKVFDINLLKSEDIHTISIETLVNLLDKAENEIREHSYRVVELSLSFGHALSLPYEQLGQLCLLSLFHDIGKMFIPVEILKKHNSLTQREWEFIMKHPELGFKITQLCDDTTLISSYILAHHENWDGSGYPYRIKGKNIPYLSRIVSIIDAFDAMTSNRSYRYTISKEAALQEIIRCSGSQFDPELVKAFNEKAFNSLNNKIIGSDNVGFMDMIRGYINGKSS